MKWIFEQAEKRAKEYKIEGVTYMLTMGVVKNIIPAIASTNATIAAACCNEALKILSYCEPAVDNYMMYMGQTGVNIQVVKFEKLENCAICQNNSIDYEIKYETKVYKLVEELEKKFNVSHITLNCEDGKYLYAARPPMLYEKHKDKFEKSIKELIDENLLNPKVKIYIFAKDLPSDIKLNPIYID